MTVFVFSIRRVDLKDVSGTAKKVFEEGLRTHFPSVDYMKGYAAGYGQGSIAVHTLSEYQHIANTIGQHTNNLIYFVYVSDDHD